MFTTSGKKLHKIRQYEIPLYPVVVSYLLTLLWLQLTSLSFFLCFVLGDQQVQNFGEPFFLVIHEGETLGEVKLRVQKKLQVSDEEFSKVLFLRFTSFQVHKQTLVCKCIVPRCLMMLVWCLQWRFAFLSLGRPEYLEDSEILSTRFQVHIIYNSLSIPALILCYFVIEMILSEAEYFCWNSEGMFTVVGSSTLGWNIPTMLQKGLTQLIRWVSFSHAALSAFHSVYWWS